MKWISTTWIQSEFEIRILIEQSPLQSIYLVKTILYVLFQLGQKSPVDNLARLKVIF